MRVPALQPFSLLLPLTLAPHPTDAPLIYFAQNGAYLAPAPGTSPSGSTSAVGFNENATLPFQVRDAWRRCCW